MPAMARRARNAAYDRFCRFCASLPFRGNNRVEAFHSPMNVTGTEAFVEEEVGEEDHFDVNQFRLVIDSGWRELNANYPEVSPTAAEVQANFMKMALLYQTFADADSRGDSDSDHSDYSEDLKDSKDSADSEVSSPEAAQADLGKTAVFYKTIAETVERDVRRSRARAAAEAEALADFTKLAVFCKAFADAAEQEVRRCRARAAAEAKAQADCAKLAVFCKTFTDAEEQEIRRCRASVAASAEKRADYAKVVSFYEKFTDAEEEEIRRCRAQER